MLEPRGSWLNRGQSLSDHLSKYFVTVPEGYSPASGAHFSSAAAKAADLSVLTFPISRLDTLALSMQGLAPGLVHKFSNGGCLL